MNKFAIGCGGVLVILLFIAPVIGLFFLGSYNLLVTLDQEVNKRGGDVQTFNTAVRRFPTKAIAGMFGFSSKRFFASQQGAERAPTVNFPSFGSPAPSPAATGSP